MDSTRARARRALSGADFRRLFTARLISQAADGLFQAVLVQIIVFLAPEGQNTAAGLAKATLILVVPFSLVGPFAGVLIDRWSRRRILMVTPLIRAAAALVLIALPRESLGLYVLALVPVSLNRFFLATAAASLPALVEERDLLVANSLATVGGTVITFAGFGLGTQIVDAVGVRTLLAVTAACWAVAGLVTARIRTPLRPADPSAHRVADVRRDLRDLAAGFRRLWRTPPALGAIASASMDQLLVGVVTSLSLVVFKERFQEGVASYGRIIAAGGAGILVGMVTVGWLEPRMSKPRMIAVAFAGAGAVCLAASLSVTGPVVFIVSFVLGLTFAYRKVPADTIVQESIPDRYRGRVFAAYDLLYAMARPVGVMLAVPLIPRLSTGALLATVGAVYVAWAPLVVPWIGRPPRARVRFSAGGRDEEVPRSIVVAGDEEEVQVERSWTEERDGQRRRRFLLRTASGDTVEVSAPEGSDDWSIDRW